MRSNGLMRVLVVDDDEWIISGVEAALGSHGFEILSASDGRAGLEAARVHDPDLIITDIMMPEMDGWTFVRQLRAEPRFALVPVLFLTSKAAAQDRISSFQLGADDYLGKPVNLPELPRRVMKALAQRRQIEADLALPPQSAPGAKGLKGSFDQIGMATLLSVLSTGRRSGILRISGGVLRSEVLIYLVRGQIYRLEVQGRGRLSADETSNLLFSCLEGAFEFCPMALRIPNELNVSMTSLLLRGAGQGAPAVVAATPF